MLLLHKVGAYMIDRKIVSGEKDLGPISRGDMFDCLWPSNEGEGPNSIQQGTRPCVICQPEKGTHSPVFYAAPISASIKTKKYPFLQNIRLRNESQVHYEQIRLIHRGMLISRTGRLNKHQLKEMDMCLSVALGNTFSSYLHIEGVSVVKSFQSGDTQIFNCVVILGYYMERFSFTDKQFLDYFGENLVYVLRSPPIIISNFLETLKGLKFVYAVVMGE